MLYGTADRRGTPLVGTFASVSGMKADDLRTFWSGHYRPQNFTFVVVGDVSKADLEKKLSKAFGGFAPKGDAAPVPTIKPVTTLALHDKVVLVDVPGAPQSVLQVVGHVPDDVPPFDPAATVMNDLLGVQFTSRLNSNLREEHGYSYGAHSAINHTTHGTVFVASTSVATPVTAPALVEVMKELNRIREAPTDTEAQRSSAFAALTYPSSFESGGSIAGTWAMATVLKADAALLDFPKAAAKVDAKAMGKAGAHVVDPANQGILVVGDRAVVEQGIRDDKLGSLGFLTVDDLLPGTAPAAK
jgi:zinc protease